MFFLCLVFCSLQTFANFSIEKISAYSLKKNSTEIVNFKNAENPLPISIGINSLGFIR
ncbi:MAG: hypothetical protein Q7U04_16175 [Bacteriovorax sp.]|nr:hypothetical protein [Bacteriovorax sp.]